jgi:hypothetical protein
VTARGRMLDPADRKLSRSGDFTLPVALGRAGRRALRGHGTLSVKLRIAFTPSTGDKAIVALRTVTFGGVNLRPAGHGQDSPPSAR